MTAAVPLGEVAEVNPRSVTEGLLATDEVDFFPMAAVDADKTVARASGRRALQQVSKGFTSFRDGDVLVAKITPCFENGKISQASVTTPVAFGSTEFHVVRCGPKLDGRYLVHFLRRQEVREDGERKMTGSGGQRRVPKHFIESLEIPLISILEQRRIAAILDKADALRTKRSEAMAQFDRLFQSIFVEMFGDPVANPRKWPKLSLAEVSTRVQIGPFGSQLHEEDYVEGGIPLVNPTHIRRGKIEPDWSLTVPEGKYGELEQYHLAEGDLIVGRRGEMGRCAVVSAKEHGWLCGTGSLFVRPDTKSIEPAYLASVVSSRSMRRHLENLAQGVTMANLNKDIVGALPIALPPLALQRAYLSRVTAVERLAELNRTTQQIEQHLFGSLQHRAFEGEL